METLDRINDYDGTMEVRAAYSAISRLSLLAQLEVAKSLLQEHICLQDEDSTTDPQIMLASAIIELRVKAVRNRPELSGLDVPKAVFEP